MISRHSPSGRGFSSEEGGLEREPNMGERPSLAWSELSAEDLDDETLTTCYKLVRKIRPLYLAAGDRWKKSDKIQEMQETPYLRYIIAKDKQLGTLAGFVSYVLNDVDDHGEPTTFIYEIHVAPQLRGLSIGTELLERVASLAPNSLTLRVFSCNERAVRFYEAHGFAIDEDLSSQAVYFMSKLCP